MAQFVLETDGQIEHGLEFLGAVVSQGKEVTHACLLRGVDVARSIA
jgi:hypothetical protein